MALYPASRCASLAGCLKITSTKFRSNSNIFDDIYPLRLRSSPEVMLPKQQWVRIHGLVEELDFCRGRPDWRQCFRNPIRELVADDAVLLRNAIAAAEAVVAEAAHSTGSTAAPLARNASARPATAR